jgi:hypothetical protein
MNIHDARRARVGETLVETLAAIVLVTLASIVLITAATTATALNRSADEQSNTIASEVSAAETNNTSYANTTGNVTFKFDNSAETENVAVTFVGGNSVVSYSYENSNTSGS